MSTEQVLKLELLEWLAGVQDRQLIMELAKWKAERQHIGVDQYNKELDEADAEIDRGDFLTHRQAAKEIGAWREK